MRPTERSRQVPGTEQPRPPGAVTATSVVTAPGKVTAPGDGILLADDAPPGDGTAVERRPHRPSHGSTPVL